MLSTSHHLPQMQNNQQIALHRYPKEKIKNDIIKSQDSKLHSCIWLDPLKCEWFFDKQFLNH